MSGRQHAMDIRRTRLEMEEMPGRCAAASMKYCGKRDDSGHRNSKDAISKKI